eukprot:3103189-Pleurochrysis_carterae.AAC.1
MNVARPRWCARTHDRTMTPASGERAGKKFNPPTIPWAIFTGGVTERADGGPGGQSGRHGAPCRGRREASGPPPPPIRACAMDGSSATARIRTRQQPRVIGERGWAQ